MRDISHHIGDKVVEEEERTWCRRLMNATAETAEYEATTEVQDVVSLVTDDIVYLTSYIIEQVRYE